MKQLKNLRWSPKWVSHLGCIKGCLNYLNLHVSDAWLFGATGHAFIINLHHEVCPSGPTAWKTEPLFRLGRNIGYDIEGVFGTKQDAEFATVQKRAWDHARDAIDQGHPCYGWELDAAEFYVIYGYDETGYYYSGPMCDAGKGPKPWQELGDTGIGVVELYSVRPGQAADDRVTVGEALAFVLQHAHSPKEWIFADYRAGLDGFDNWIKALETGKAADSGLRYNAAVWAECRRYAVPFLQEAQRRIDAPTKPLFDGAIRHYQVVSRQLDRVAAAYPFSPEATMAPLGVDEQSHAAAAALQQARAAEASGLQALQEILTSLGSAQGIKNKAQ